MQHSRKKEKIECIMYLLSLPSNSTKMIVKKIVENTQAEKNGEEKLDIMLCAEEPWISGS
jgi:hypothetical protein